MMRREGVTQQRFAEMLGIPASSLSGVLNERTQPTMNQLLALHRVFPNIRLEWLLSGEGDMYESAEDASEPAQPVAEPTLFGDMPAPAVEAPPAEVAVQPQVIREIMYRDKPPRQITEVRIFFDDGTFETFSGSPGR